MLGSQRPAINGFHIFDGIFNAIEVLFIFEKCAAALHGIYRLVARVALVVIIVLYGVSCMPLRPKCSIMCLRVLTSSGASASVNCRVYQLHFRLCLEIINFTNATFVRRIQIDVICFECFTYKINICWYIDTYICR